MRLRVRDLLIALPILLLGVAFFVAGVIVAGVAMLLVALAALVLMARASGLAARTARYTEQGPQDVMLRWQYPGNSGGGGGGGGG